MGLFSGERANLCFRGVKLNKVPTVGPIMYDDVCTSVYDVLLNIRILSG